MKRIFLALIIVLFWVSFAFGQGGWIGGGGSGNVATDKIFTAKGDLAIGTGSGTAAKLTVGANYSLPYALSTETTGWKWLAPVPSGIVGFNSSGILGVYTSISIDDSAAQFYSATASKGTLKVLLSGSTSGKLMTLTSSQTDNRTVTLPDATDTLVGKATTDTLTNKTLTSSAHTGSTNTIKTVKYLYLAAPARCDETGALLDTTKTNATFGQCQFSNSAANTANYAIYEAVVPSDIDTAIDLVLKTWAFSLGNTDTGKHYYKIAMCNPAASAAADCTVGDEIDVKFAGDGSGASGDIEYVNNVTLTGWKSAVTAGRYLKIRVSRAGDDGTDDTSTVNSFSKSLIISYGSTQ